MSGAVENDPKYITMVQQILSNNTKNDVIQSERPISTQQFYRGNSNDCGPSNRTATSMYAPSESSVFKLPNTVQGHLNWARVEGPVNSIINSYRTSDINKDHLKLWVKASHEILLVAQQYPHINVVELLDLTCQRLKDKFYGGRNHTPSTLSNSGIQPETSQIDRYGSVSSLSTIANDNRENTGFASSHFPSAACSFNPCVALHRNTTYHSQIQANQTNTGFGMHTNTTLQPQIQANQTNTGLGMHTNTTLQPQSQANQTNTGFGMHTNTTFQPQSQANQLIPHPAMHRNTTVLSQNPASQLIPHRAMNGNKTVQSQNPGRGKGGRGGQPLKPPNRVLKADREFLTHNTNQLSLDVSKNDTLSSKGVSRFGRQIKSPHQFWKGLDKKINASSVVNSSRSKISPKTTSPAVDLNETLTLRNNKLIVKNTPVPKKKKTVKNTLCTIEEQTTKPVDKVKQNVKRKPGKRKSSLKENKENSLNASKVKEAPKKVSTKVVKNPPVKRKSKNVDITLSKRKKVEENNEMNSSWDSDELFDEPIFVRKGVQNQVLSPSNGLHSVKKALAGFSGKETPPAKLISQLIEPDVVPKSTAKELPETTSSQVVKRITKIVEKNVPKKVAKKTGPAKKSNTEDPRVEKIMNDVIGKSLYSSSGKTTLSVFQTSEVDSADGDLDMSDSDMYDDEF